MHSNNPSAIEKSVAVSYKNGYAFFNNLLGGDNYPLRKSNKSFRIDFISQCNHIILSSYSAKHFYACFLHFFRYESNSCFCFVFSIFNIIYILSSLATALPSKFFIKNSISSIVGLSGCLRINRVNSARVSGVNIYSSLSSSYSAVGVLSIPKR